MLRYRKLSWKRDLVAEAQVSRETPGGGIGRGVAVLKAGEAPVTVDAEEGVGSVEELTRRLQLHDLMPGDLVYSQGGWMTFSEAPEFLDVTEGLTDRRALGLTLRSIARFLFVVGAIAAYAWLRMPRH